MGSKKSLVQTDADSASMNSQSIPEDDYSSFFSVVLDGATDSRGEEETLYECRRCGNRYGRVDHIKRHYQSRECRLSVHLSAVAYQDQTRMDVHSVALNVRRASIESERLVIERVDGTNSCG